MRKLLITIIQRYKEILKLLFIIICLRDFFTLGGFVQRNK